MAQPSTDRLVAGTAAVAVQALIGCFLLFGLSVRITAPIEQALTVINLTAPLTRPKPPETQPRRESRRRAGKAAPPALKARPTDIVAPRIEHAPPPPVVAAMIASTGAEAHAGAAPTPGPGTGAGGQGNGLGGGGEGDGDGGGGDGEIGPELLKGEIRDSDYPRALWAAGIGGTVSVRYHVEVDGRATGCSITRSSGNAELDATTCRLIEQRFRYAPARGGDGRPVRSIIVENHSWIIDDSERTRRRPA